MKKNNNLLTERWHRFPKSLVILMLILLWEGSLTTALGSPSSSIASTRLSQERVKVSGVVLNQAKNPIQGAVIFIKGDNARRNQDIRSNVLGQFELRVSVGQTIVIAAQGYESREVKVTEALRLRVFLSKTKETTTEKKDIEPRIPISGIVVDTEGAPMVGATIMVKERQDLGGVLSDNQGRFKFDVPPGGILLVQFIGYQDREYKITKESSLRVILHEVATNIEDIVIVGYGTQRKESVVGAISQVHTDDLVNSGTTYHLSHIQ